MTTAQILYKLINDVSQKSDSDFSGLGLVVYSNLQELPFSPLKTIEDSISIPVTDYVSIVNILTNISKIENKYHDGFHLLNENFELTHLSQYISPPIAQNIDISEEFGSRYRTALYTSIVPGILCCGVLGKNYPITIFQNAQTLNANSVSTD
jgi:hypothetical protein